MRLMVLFDTLTAAKLCGIIYALLLLAEARDYLTLMVGAGAAKHYR